MFSKKKWKKNTTCDLRELNRWLGTSVYIALVCPSASLTNVGIPRSSIHGMRDFNIIAGFVGAGTGFWVFAGDAFVREWDGAFFTGPRDTGYGISHFARDHGIKIPNPVQSRGKNPAGRSEKDRIDLIFSDQKKNESISFFSEHKANRTHSGRPRPRR